MKTTLRTPGSSAIEGIKYDTDTQVLTITMANEPPRHHGEVLRYLNVPEDTFNKFLNAESKGSFFNKYIRDFYQLE